MLSKEDRRIAFGIFHTPKKIVKKALEWLMPFKEKAIILDLGAGEGAFLEELIDWNYRAVEIDERACEKLKERFDSKRIFCGNALKDVSRERLDIPEDAFLVVVGNPPYNDWTSLYRKGKKGQFEMDKDVFDRDLGIAFMKAMAKLKADVVCILHPMSYLIKRANFKRLEKFLKEYRLLRAFVFPSFVFSKRKIGFPVLVAYYERNSKGFSWQELLEFEFEVNEKVFRLKDIQTVDGFIQKYPRKGISSIGVYFHTFRDINSLIRNRDFLLEPTKNTIPVEPEDFPKYAYLIALKHYILSKGVQNFWFYGNFSPLIDREFFLKHSDHFVAYALRRTKNLPEEIKKRFLKEGSDELVEEYFEKLYRW